MNSAGFNEKSELHPPALYYGFLPRTTRDAIGDVFSGLVVALTNIALALSFAAVLFKDGLQSGYPTGLWSILVTMVIAGLIIGCMTAIPPLTGNPDNAVVAAMGILSAELSAPMLENGIATATVVQTVVMSLMIVAVASGIVFFLIGWLRLGQALRFVPYPLISGFLASTGTLLMLSAYTIVAGRRFEFYTLVAGVPPGSQTKLVLMVAIGLALWALPKLIKSPLTSPITFVVLAVGLKLLLATTGLADQPGWYLSKTGSFSSWSPFSLIVEHR